MPHATTRVPRRRRSPSLETLIRTARRDTQTAIGSLMAVAAALDHCLATDQLPPAMREAFARLLAQASNHGPVWTGLAVASTLL